MAEFQDVMRQWRRMCNEHTCSRNKEAFTGLPICPIAATHEGYPCDEDPIDWTEKATKRLEEIVMSWAAENPEPVYPTWGEWLEQQGICFSRLTNYSRVDGISIPQVFNYQIEGKTAFICGDKVNDPIPADLAQKLGIEPKEG